MINLNLDRVLIEVDDVEKTEKGVYVSKAKTPEETLTGVVTHVGKGKLNNEGNFLPMDIKVGDKVMFEYGRKITVSSVQYYLVRSEDIILTL